MRDVLLAECDPAKAAMGGQDGRHTRLTGGRVSASPGVEAANVVQVQGNLGVCLASLLKIMNCARGSTGRRVVQAEMTDSRDGGMPPKSPRCRPSWSGVRPRGLLLVSALAGFAVVPRLRGGSGAMGRADVGI
jgi:hypothetical protein